MNATDLPGDRYFSDLSICASCQPTATILMGGVAVGKTAGRCDAARHDRLGRYYKLRKFIVSAAMERGQERAYSNKAQRGQTT